MELKKCPKCNSELKEEDKFCSKCGNPIIEEKVEVKEVDEETKAELKKSSKILYIVIVVVAMLLCGAGYYYYNVKSVNDYKTKYENFALDVLTSGAEAEKCGNLIVSVWYNTIFKIDNEETNKYTKNLSGSFNNDFSTSFLYLVADKAFTQRISKLKEDRSKFEKTIKELKDYPKDWEEAYFKVKKLYDTYVDLNKLITNVPDGSLNSYTTRFKQYDTNMVNSYKEVKKYLSW